MFAKARKCHATPMASNTWGVGKLYPYNLILELAPVTSLV